MRLPDTLQKAWRWVRHDVPDPETEYVPHDLIESLKEQEEAARFSVSSNQDYLENLMVYRDQIKRKTRHDGINT